MDKSLYATISNAFWHDVWTNACHDDRDFIICRMLAWQVYSDSSPSRGPPPFKGKSLFALLMFGLFHKVLRSLPLKVLEASDPTWLEHFNPEERDDVETLRLEQSPAHRLLSEVRDLMPQMCRDIVSRMEAEELNDFAKFCTEVQVYYRSEFEARVKYNKENSCT